jgi:hypothetical protein
MAVGRNDPCPCGSGKKHKECCGAVIAIAASAVRSCGGCTACCDGWVTGIIEGHEMYPGSPCHFRGERCCSIYERRPQYPCRDFVCGWLQPQSPFPEAFRPDRLGVLILRTTWEGRDAYVLNAAGREPDEALIAWMQAFSLRTRQPVFYERDGERFGIGPPEVERAMQGRLARGERLP